MAQDPTQQRLCRRRRSRSALNVIIEAHKREQSMLVLPNFLNWTTESHTDDWCEKFLSHFGV